jgi:phosphate starvation-inducible PhoH-like protein
MSETHRRPDPAPTREDYVDLDGVDQLALLGSGDAHLRFLEEKLGGTASVRGETLFLRGPADRLAAVRELALDMIARVQANQEIDEVTLSYLWERRQASAELDEPLGGEALMFAANRRQSVKVKTAGQQRYVDAIRLYDVVFAIGPAGTGKTYLAVVMAMDYLKRKLVDRIVLVRPAIEAGEQLGFLPGDLQEKINPYLRPLYDALSDIIGPGRIARYMSQGLLEASPLAYMRGRTLNNAFVILDEAQNTTIGQMKMFLTRLGFQAKAVVTGDITQIDLQDHRRSGLIHARQVLRDTEGISFVDFDGRDIVRHPLVRRIVDAFEEAEQQGNGRT